MSASRPANLRSVVYVVGFDHYVKIGWSSNFAQRKADLQQGLPKKLEIFLLMPGTVADERRLHAQFAKHRLRGEWFAFAGSLAAWIEEKAGRPLSARRRGRLANQPRPVAVEAQQLLDGWLASSGGAQRL
jgi:hypothetical protein